VPGRSAAARPVWPLPPRDPAPEKGASWQAMAGPAHPPVPRLRLPRHPPDRPLAPPTPSLSPRSAPRIPPLPPGPRPASPRTTPPAPPFARKSPHALDDPRPVLARALREPSRHLGGAGHAVLRSPDGGEEIVDTERGHERLRLGGADLAHVDAEPSLESHPLPEAAEVGRVGDQEQVADAAVARYRPPRTRPRNGRRRPWTRGRGAPRSRWGTAPGCRRRPCW
jgi:hypothetical protein